MLLDAHSILFSSQGPLNCSSSIWQRQNKIAREWSSIPTMFLDARSSLHSIQFIRITRSSTIWQRQNKTAKVEWSWTDYVAGYSFHCIQYSRVSRCLFHENKTATERNYTDYFTGCKRFIAFHPVHESLSSSIWQKQNSNIVNFIPTRLLDAWVPIHPSIHLIF
jgi:hypothetical protein